MKLPKNTTIYGLANVAGAVAVTVVSNNKIDQVVLGDSATVAAQYITSNDVEISAISLSNNSEDYALVSLYLNGTDAVNTFLPVTYLPSGKSLNYTSAGWFFF